MPNRRSVLALGAVAGGMLATAKVSTEIVARWPGGANPRLSPAAAGALAAPPPFSVPLPIPRDLRPIATVAGVDIFRTDITPATVEILPAVRTRALTFGGQFVGPTIRARTGRPALVQFVNRLDMAANVHLHGGHVAAENDGFPTDVIDPGHSRWYTYPNSQPGATLWYHDHAHGMESEDVYRGLHGFYLLEDDAERGLQLPRGEFDVPILLRDAAFAADGSLDYASFERPFLLANGRPQPFFRVAARKYRLRLLNAGNTRVLRLTLGDGATMTQVGSDGGLLPAPVARTEIVLASAERQDVVVDFARFPLGSQVVLRDATAGPVLRFDVVRQAADPSRVPAVLRPLPPAPAATVTRDVTMSFDLTRQMPVGMLNGHVFDPNRVDFTVKRGSTEIWRIGNGDPPGFDHTFHMHMTHFRVLDRDGARPTADDAGLKDTIYVPAGARNVRVQATFPNHTGRYVYHCHFLEHSAAGMMGVIEIVP
ncbi:multicopper oxidase family protein [Dactylosporangium sp. NPDC048998]|uniref:multicopper oxidase family protein n=1 Tax=Dactylosporangium sp. NPDC048998 TaxID=3363976 RepID=UPI00371FDF83